MFEDWLRLLVATEVVAANRLTEVIQECDELVAILTSIVKKARKSEKYRVK